MFLLPGVHPDPGPTTTTSQSAPSSSSAQGKAASSRGCQNSFTDSPAYLCSLISAVLRTAVLTCKFKSLHRLCPSPSVSSPFPFSLCFKNPQLIFKDLVHSSPPLEPSLTSLATHTHTKAKFVDSHCPCNTRCFLRQAHGTLDRNCLLAVSPTSLGDPSGHWFDFGIRSPK